MASKQQIQQPEDNGDLIDIQDKSGWLRMPADNPLGDNVQVDRHSGIREGQKSKEISAAM